MVRGIAQSSLIVAALSLVGCGGTTLPDMPQAVSGEASSVEWLGLVGLDDTVLDASAFAAAASLVRLRILDEANNPVASAVEFVGTCRRLRRFAASARRRAMF